MGLPTVRLPSPALARDPALDGARALAISVVLAFHGGSRLFLGGHVGVDVFFVLSGYLITHSLLTSRTHNGRLDLLGFWRRRAVRLLPAAAVCITVTSAAIALVVTASQRPAIRSDAFSGIGYFANWHFLAEGREYFRQDVGASPFLHLWSLSVEEQYYLIWPFVLAAVLLMAKRSKRLTVARVVPSLFVAATAWSVYVALTERTDRVFFGTDTHAYQLLLGATISVALAHRSATDQQQRPTSLRVGWSIVLPVAGVVAITVVAPWTAYWRGFAATFCAGLLIIGLQHEAGSLGRRCLALRPLAQLGVISYGVYLWHWPIITVVDRVWTLGPMLRTGLSASGAILIAYFSWNVLEAPLINGVKRRFTRRGPLAATMLLTAIVALVGASAIASAVALDRIPFAPRVQVGGGELLAGGTLTPIPASLGKTPFIPTPGPYSDGICYESDPAESPVDCRITEGSFRVLLLGDSHAGDLVPALTLIAQRSDWALSAVVMSGCPWRPNLRYIDWDRPSCAKSSAAITGSWFDSLDPDLIILANHPLLESGYHVRSLREHPGASYDDMIKAETRGSIALLQRDGAEVILIEPRPSASFHVQTCLEASQFIEQCAFEATDEALTESRWFRDLAAELTGVRAVEMIDLVCPRYPTCDAIINGTLVRYDSNHLYAGFSQGLQPQLVQRLNEGDVSDPARAVAVG